MYWLEYRENSSGVLWGSVGGGGCSVDLSMAGCLCVRYQKELNNHNLNILEMDFEVSSKIKL